MFDIGWSELAVIAVVALIAIGPRDLPKALYTAGKWIRSARKVAGEFQRHVDDMMREAELDDLKKNMQQARDFNIKKQIEQTIDPHGELRDGVDPRAELGTPEKPGWSKPGAELPAGKPVVPADTAAPASPPTATAAVPGQAPAPPQPQPPRTEPAERQTPAAAPQGSDQMK